MSLFLDDSEHRLSRLESLIGEVRSRVTSLEVTPLPIATSGLGASAMVNYIRNSDFNFSVNAYDGTAGTDAQNECKSWYRHFQRTVTDGAITTGTPTLTCATSTPFTSSADVVGRSVVIYGAGASGATFVTTISAWTSTSVVTLAANASTTVSGATVIMGTIVAENATQALKALDHSTYAANEGAGGDTRPIWDKVNGYPQIGAVSLPTLYTLDHVIAKNIATPGITLHLTFIAKMTAAAASSYPTMNIFAGIWDMTSGQERWLEGTDLTITATPIGTTGATTYEYMVVATTDWGHTYKSTVGSTATGNATLSTSNYNSLSWTKVTGVTVYELYRNKAGTYHKITEIFNGATSYYDQGGNFSSVAGWPTVNQTKAKAYVEIEDAFDTATEIAEHTGAGITHEEWRSFYAKIPVPATYNSAVTTSKQVLRIGHTAAFASGEERRLLIDRVGLSTVDGAWAISSLDLAATGNPDGLPASSTQGDTGTSEGGAGGRCVALDTPCLVWRNRRTYRVPISDIMPGDLLESGGVTPNSVRRVRRSVVDGYFALKTKNGMSLRCSGSHRVITSRVDARGTPVEKLRVSQKVLTWRGGRVEQSEIVELKRRKGKLEVVMLTLTPGHFYIAGGIVSHNLKILEL